MTREIDLKQVRFFLENARQQLRNISSKAGTNGKDAIQQAITEAIKELKKNDAQDPKQASAVPAR